MLPINMDQIFILVAALGGLGGLALLMLLLARGLQKTTGLFTGRHRKPRPEKKKSRVPVEMPPEEPPVSLPAAERIAPEEPLPEDEMPLEVEEPWEMASEKTSREGALPGETEALTVTPAEMSEREENIREDFRVIRQITCIHSQSYIDDVDRDGL